MINTYFGYQTTLERLSNWLTEPTKCLGISRRAIHLSLTLVFKLLMWNLQVFTKYGKLSNLTYITQIFHLPTCRQLQKAAENKFVQWATFFSIVVERILELLIRRKIISLKSNVVQLRYLTFAPLSNWLLVLALWR